MAMARSAAARRISELRELQTPRFKVDELGREVPDVRAEAAIIYNPETGEVLWENHSHDQRSMASITKVMTAIVFLESNTPLTNIVTVQPVDVREFGGDAAEIVPHAAQDRLDLGVGFFGERGLEVIAADAVLAQERPEGAQDSAGKIRHRLARDRTQELQHPDGEEADSTVAQSP